MTKKTFALHIQSFEKYTTQTFGCKTATMELCNKISQLSLVKIISKKQLFFKVELGLKHHSKSLLKIAKKKKKKNQPPGHNFFLPSALGVVYKYKKIDILFLKLGFTPCKAEQPL